MLAFQRVYIHIHTSWLHMYRFSLCLFTSKMEPHNLTAPLKAILSWLLSNLLTKPPCTLFFPPKTHPLLSPNLLALPQTHQTLSLPGLCLCSSLPGILLSQLIKWLVHSYVSGVSSYVTHSREPLKLALSHHPICFYQSTDLYLKLCTFYLITVPHIHKIVGELQEVLSFVHLSIPSSLKGSI